MFREIDNIPLNFLDIPAFSRNVGISNITFEILTIPHNIFVYLKNVMRRTQ